MPMYFGIKPQNEKALPPVGISKISVAPFRRKKLKKDGKDTDIFAEYHSVIEAHTPEALHKAYDVLLAAGYKVGYDYLESSAPIKLKLRKAGEFADIFAAALVTLMESADFQKLQINGVPLVGTDDKLSGKDKELRTSIRERKKQQLAEALKAEKLEITGFGTEKAQKNLASLLYSAYANHLRDEQAKRGAAADPLTESATLEQAENAFHEMLTIEPARGIQKPILRVRGLKPEQAVAAEGEPALKTAGSMVALLEGIQDFTDPKLGKVPLFALKRDAAGNPAKDAIAREPEEEEYSGPLSFFQRVQKRMAYDYKYDPNSFSAQLYLIGNFINTATGLLRGNINEAFMGLFFGFPNLLNAQGNTLSRPRSAEEIVADVSKDLTVVKTGENGHEERIFNFNKSKDIGTGKRFGKGRLVDDILNWTNSSKQQNNFAFKTLFALFAASNALMGGLRGKKLAVVDEDLNTVLGSNGRALEEVKMDGTLLRSGILSGSAYLIAATVTPEHKDGVPLISNGAENPFTVKSDAEKGLRGIFNRFDQQIEGNFIGDKVRGAGRVLTEDPKSWTGSLMLMHNMQIIGSESYKGMFGTPRLLERYETKFARERLIYFTKGGEQSLFDQYIGPKGIFGERFDSILDSKGHIRDDVMKAREAIIERYDALRAQRDAHVKSYDKAVKKDRSTPKPPELASLEKELHDIGASYRSALFLGCMDEKDKPKKGFFGFGARRSDAQRMIGYHESFLNNRYVQVGRDSVEELMYVRALNKDRHDKIQGEHWVSFARMLYSACNGLGAFMLSQIDKNRPPVEVNQANATFDKTALFQEIAKELERGLPNQVQEYVRGFDPDRHAESSLPRDELNRALENFAKAVVQQDENQNMPIQNRLSKQQVVYGVLTELLRTHRPVECGDWKHAHESAGEKLNIQRENYPTEAGVNRDKELDQIRVKLDVGNGLPTAIIDKNGGILDPIGHIVAYLRTKVAELERVQKSYPRENNAAKSQKSGIAEGLESAVTHIVHQTQTALGGNPGPALAPGS